MSEKAPLYQRELQKSKNAFEPEGKLTKKLASKLLLPEIKPFELEIVNREKLLEVSEEPITPKKSEWLAGAIKPKKQIMAGEYKPRVQYKGTDLEPLWVLGTDDRRTYSDTRYPWGCVCKINTSAGSGSGVIIGPRHVLTASHVVNWATSAGVNGSVDVHRAGGAVSATTAIVRVLAFTQVTGTIGWTELDEDYAVLTTADRIGDMFGWFGARTYSSSWDDDPYWFNIGYPGDIAGANFPIYQNGRTLDEDAWDFGGGRAMETNADTFFGQSGGPMAAFWDDGPYVVSVVSAQSSSGSPENYCSGGRDLTRLVRMARTQTP